MKTAIKFLLILVTFNVSAQSAQSEIDEQIWKPFTAAWESNDGAAYNAIHSADVWRINPGRLLVGEEYRNNNTSKMQGQPRNSIIEFSFETRTSNGDNAYEVGYYRITTNNDGTTNYYIGRFHVALKKIDGSWKITQDWDTGVINGVKITPESVASRDFTHFL